MHLKTYGLDESSVRVHGANDSPHLGVLEVEGATKSFIRNKSKRHKTVVQSLEVFNRISFSAKPGEFITIVGPSGCGKSTLLACIAGLRRLDSGTIRFDGQEVVEPLQSAAVVFQQPSLLPWRSVARNVSYGLELRRELTNENIKAQVNDAIDLVGLRRFTEHYPHELSGGMQQRVNLARALATIPRLLLMDEPFGALDALTKSILQDELMRLAQETTRTTIFITHDVEEAVYLGDRILVMSARPGVIQDVIDVDLGRPRSREVMSTARFQLLVNGLRSTLMSQSEKLL